MSNETNDQPVSQPPVPSGSQQEQLQCGHCGATFLIDSPQPLIINQPSVSLIVIPHDTPVYCPNCGRAFAPMIVPTSPLPLTIQWVDVPDRRNKLVLVGSRVPH